MKTGTWVTLCTYKRHLMCAGRAYVILHRFRIVPEGGSVILFSSVKMGLLGDHLLVTCKMPVGHDTVGDRAMAMDISTKRIQSALHKRKQTRRGFRR